MIDLERFILILEIFNQNPPINMIKNFQIEYSSNQTGMVY